MTAMLRTVSLLSTLVLLLSGCAGPRSVAESGFSENVVLLPTVARSFGELSASLHPELREPPRQGVTVNSLRKKHDTHRYTEERVRWGSDERLTVLQFTDTDRPTRSETPMSAWFLGPDPGDGAPEVVGAVLYRNFDGVPRGEDPYELLASLAAAFPAPWVLCTPSGGEWTDLLLAYDPARGIKLALLRHRDQPMSWSVDHVEFVSTLLPMKAWWHEKGYGDCPEEDTVR